MHLILWKLGTVLWDIAVSQRDLRPLPRVASAASSWLARTGWGQKGQKHALDNSPRGSSKRRQAVRMAGSESTVLAWLVT